MGDIFISRVQKTFHPDKLTGVYLCPNCGSILEYVNDVGMVGVFVGCLNDNCSFFKKTGYKHRLLIKLR
jgi:hypothetical protein